MKFPFRMAVPLGMIAFLGTLGCGGGEVPPPDSSAVGGESADAPRLASRLPEDAQAISLLGEPLFPPALPEEVLASREQQLAEALHDLEADPQGTAAIIWAARRYAYLGDYRKAIDLFSEGIALHPDDARLYRHRGHRYISVREFDNAIADFRKAAELIEGTKDEVEPDGQPNSMGIPTSTLHFNIWYHYGLAHFLEGNFEEAEEIYRRCWDASIHPDSKVATAHWWYMSLRRSGRAEEAQALIQGMDLDALASEVIESGSYLELLRLYAGASAMQGEAMPELDPATMEGAALGYGVGAFYLYNGHADEARAVYEGILSARDQWASFGYIAAEADLARMGGE
ncbi:MAG: tetratricopeptide repeat protein [Gemmatimonadota bacterium]